MVVAAPLIVLARPWVRLWRALPLGRAPLAARSLGQGERTRRCAALAARSAARWRASCCSASCCSAGTCRRCSTRRCARAPLHALEHTLFFATALLFWKQVIHSPPLHAPPVARRSASRYVVGAMVVSWVLAVVLALAPAPALRPLRARGHPPGRHLGARRSAARRGRHVGARLDHLRDRDLRLRPPLAHAGRRSGAGRAARGRALGGLMPAAIAPLAHTSSPARSSRSCCRSRSDRGDVLVRGAVAPRHRRTLSGQAEPATLSARAA